MSVHDHGPGIPDEFKPRVFGKFAQAEREDGHKEGSGLGLNIISKIVAEQIPLWETSIVETTIETRAELSAAV